MRTTDATEGRAIGGRRPSLVHPAFCRYGEAGATGPILVTVPHAGRDYPADVTAEARAGVAGLALLEDRHADRLAHGAIAAGHAVIVARVGRAVIDLNRDEDEVDGESVRDLPHNAPSRTSAKLRGGLGLVPHRHHGLGELWHQRPTYAAVRARVDAFHAPYHAQVAEALARIVAMHGAALLLDLHSMPPIRQGVDRGPGPTVVIGDRFGRSAGEGAVRLAAAIAARHGHVVALNDPYAGGHTLDRHGRSERGVEAIQIEIDRTLYLDDQLDRPGAGAAAADAMIAQLVEALGRHVGSRPLAAE